MNKVVWLARCCLAALVLEGSNCAILHKDGAIYDSMDGWNVNTPPYYPGSNYAVDLELK